MPWFMRKYCPFKAFFEKLIYFTLRNNREFKQITTTIKKKKKKQWSAHEQSWTHKKIPCRFDKISDNWFFCLIKSSDNRLGT